MTFFIIIIIGIVIVKKTMILIWEEKLTKKKKRRKSNKSKWQLRHIKHFVIKVYMKNYTVLFPLHSRANTRNLISFTS